MIDSGGFAGRIRPPVHNGFALSSPPKRKASHRPRNVRHLLSVLAVTALTGCSVHPIPDDVAYPIPTENIVSQARCELRDGLVEKVAIWLFKDLELPQSDPLLNPEFVAQNLKKNRPALPSLYRSRGLGQLDAHLGRV
jgi:hypothetical protein